ncbi:MAG TPA: DedA family protein [Gaiellaceae bacterium]|nr:DedA family protein [Gaiellaceae bacterium]
MPVASILGELTERITSAIGDHGLYAVFLFMLGDAVLPANEAVMLYGGALAAGALSGSVVLFGAEVAQGLPSYLAVALAGTLGSTLGAIIGWAIGTYAGRPFVHRYGKWMRISEVELGRAERWFDRWGSWAVFLSRLTPVVRSVAPVAAGTLRMPFGRYTIVTLAGSAIYCFAYAGAGYLVGTEWEQLYERVGVLEYVVLAALAVGAVWWVARRTRRRRRAIEDSSGA